MEKYHWTAKGGHYSHHHLRASMGRYHWTAKEEHCIRRRHRQEASPGRCQMMARGDRSSHHRASSGRCRWTVTGEHRTRRYRLELSVWSGKCRCLAKAGSSCRRRVWLAWSARCRWTAGRAESRVSLQGKSAHNVVSVERIRRNWKSWLVGSWPRTGRVVRVGGVLPAAERLAVAETARCILQAAKRLGLVEHTRCRGVRQQEAAANEHESRPSSHLHTPCKEAMS